MPDFALLRKAVSIIETIPDNEINLDQVRIQKTCGTVCCAAGWLAYHPDFVAVGLSMPTPNPDGSVGGLLRYRDFEMFWDKALSMLFNMDQHEAAPLFCPRGDYDFDELYFPGTDKELWLKRVRDYLGMHGELEG